MQRFFPNLHLISRKRDESDQRGNESTANSQMAEMLSLCKKGDRLAQKRLFDSLASKMLPLCKRYMGDDQSAQDVLQEGFITLFTKLDAYEVSGSFEGWARRIFVNAALMQLRKQGTLMEKGIDNFETVGTEDSRIAHNLDYEHLIKLIGDLPPGFRTVFNLYVIEGFSHKEIAQALGISENTSRSQLQRARMLLQKRLKEE
ncbi:MAG: RNA polymerase sigma factor [Bacteroidales bacterium]|nr:RNA polymerase sigma factor [Bacteroidales bacterium]MDD7088392.1 RNA polymerase sigma factor [Bacteroidales bacterium]